MKFADDILSVFDVRYDAVAAHRRYVTLCAAFIACVSSEDCVAAGHALYRGVRDLIQEAMQAVRAETKLTMLRSPDWLMRVVTDLGGVAALRRWYHKPPPKKAETKEVEPRPILSLEEEECRAHIRDCAKACAHPLIFRDRFRVDKDGRFRLAPRGLAEQSKDPDYYYEYSYDARPFTKLTGLDAPITLWPDEVFVFLKYHQDKAEAGEANGNLPVRVSRAKLKDWLAEFLKMEVDLPMAAPLDAIHKPP